MEMRNRRRERGFAQTLELLLLATSVVGLVTVTSASVGSEITREYEDLAAAVASLDQSYSLGGMAVAHPGDPEAAGALAGWTGSRFVDGDAGGTGTPTPGVTLCTAPDRETAARLAGALR